MAKNGTNGFTSGTPRTYQTKEGTVLEFRPVSSWTVNFINSKWEKRKPLPPKYKTEAGFEDYNSTDPHYLQQVKVWEQDKAAEMNETMVRLGILSEPPSEIVALYSAEFPDIEAKNIKVHWVYSLLGENVEEFFNVLMGQTAVTEAGLAEAGKSFPSPD